MTAVEPACPVRGFKCKPEKSNLAPGGVTDYLQTSVQETPTHTVVWSASLVPPSQSTSPRQSTQLGSLLSPPAFAAVLDLSWDGKEHLNLGGSQVWWPPGEETITMRDLMFIKSSACLEFGHQKLLQKGMF